MNGKANDMKPLFSYYGGKQRMASKIVPLLPKHTVYVEPFAGGAAVFFAKPWPPVMSAVHYREVLNDIDQRIVNLYHVIRTPGLREQFIERLQLTPYARIEYRSATKRAGTKTRSMQEPAFHVYQGLDDQVADAVAYYVNVQMSFAKKFNGGWGTAVFSRNSGATWVGNVSRLPEYIDRMAGVHIECDDALAVIKRWDSPQTLFYCDPPYPDTRQGYVGGRYTTAHLQELVDTLDQCAGSFVLSNYDQPNVTFPDAWERFDFAAYCAATGKGKAGKDADRTQKANTGNFKRTEVVWRVDRSANARPELQKVWENWEMMPSVW